MRSARLGPRTDRRYTPGRPPARQPTTCQQGTESNAGARTAQRHCQCAQAGMRRKTKMTCPRRRRCRISPYGTTCTRRLRPRPPCRSRIRRDNVCSVRAASSQRPRSTSPRGRRHSRPVVTQPQTFGRICHEGTPHTAPSEFPRDGVWCSDTSRAGTLCSWAHSACLRNSRPDSGCTFCFWRGHCPTLLCRIRRSVWRPASSTTGIRNNPHCWLQRDCTWPARIPCNRRTRHALRPRRCRMRPDTARWGRPGMRWRWQAAGSTRRGMSCMM